MKNNKNLNSKIDDLFFNLDLPTDFEIKKETNNKNVSNGLKIYFGNAKQRFNNSLIIQNNGCWIYPKRWIMDDNGIQLLPKNYSAIIHKVKFPSGCITNTCGNKKCVNPKHLKDYPKQQQALDTIKKRKILKGDNHHQSKLTEKDIKDIKKQFVKLLKERNGKSKGIATIIHKQYSFVSLVRICQIIKNK
jgi:hypothetical protein